HALAVETRGSELTAERQHLKSDFHRSTWGMSVYRILKSPED
ncbi:MAG: hypothetical protein ACI89J_004262, partial [Hyphomicrobiaceae bacterium]